MTEQTLNRDDIVANNTSPYPDTDFSPALQRTIKRKIESGEDTGMEREEFFRLLGRISEPQESDQ